MSKYDQSFKDEAVRLALTSNQPIAKTAKDLGINKPTLCGKHRIAPLMKEHGIQPITRRNLK